MEMSGACPCYHKRPAVGLWTVTPGSRGRFRALLTGVAVLLVWALLIASAAGSKFQSCSARMTDDAGKKISFSRPFTRIISLYGAHTENLFFLGLDPEIIGVGRNEVYPENALEKPVFSYHDDPERFLAARPDLVLVRPMINRGYPALIRRLEASGITVVSLQPNGATELYDYWWALGCLTGREAAAREMIRSFKKQVADIARQTGMVQEKKRVYFEAIHSRMKTFVPGSMAQFVLETAGGINVATDALSSRGTNIGNYGKERILARAGEIEVYLAQKGVMNPVTKEMIRTEPGFGIIRAVKEDRVYLVDETLVSRPVYRLLKGMKIIAGLLYPQLDES